MSSRIHRRTPPICSSPRPRPATSFENFFIQSLVTAGTCHRHRQKRETGRRSPIQRRSHSTAAAAAAAKEVEITREEYTDLVDIYPDFEADNVPPPPAKPTHYPLASRLTLTPAQELLGSPPQEEQEQAEEERRKHTPLPPESADHAQQLHNLQRQLRRQLGRTSHTKLWETYQSLPTPRPSYLSHVTILRLFRHLAWTEFKSTPLAMERYFLLLNEVLAHPSIHLSDGVWNSAISFAGRWLRNVSSTEMKSAVEVWMRMEKSGVEATEVTFNILYDLAVRAGRFALAETIEAELRARGLPLNRFFRTSVIYHAGLRRDGEGVRRAFRELVDAGEIVDTGVMNCVIISLLRAGEAGAAGSVFLRMKALHEAKFGTNTPGDWREDKALGFHLNNEARRLRREEGVHMRSFFGGKFAMGGRREDVQRAAPIAPDARTYRILVGWAMECGELEKGKELVEEMKGKGLKVYGSVYVGLLRGFQKFGGFAGGEWTARALEEIWQEVLLSLEKPPFVDGAQKGDVDEDDINPPGPSLLPDDDSQPPLPETSRPTYFAPSLALAAVNAFYKCTGRQRMLEVWQDIEHRWTEQGASEEELEGVRRIVAGLRSPGEGEYWEEGG